MLNMVVPKDSDEKAKFKQFSDIEDTNDLVYSYLIEACFKHPEAMSVATNYTEE